MDKRELASIVSVRTGICRKDCERVLSEAVGAIKEAVVRGEEVALGGFGTFHAQKYKAQSFVKPKTGERYSKPARRLPAFKPMPSFSKSVKAEPIEH